MDGVAKNRVLDHKSYPPLYFEGMHWPFISTFLHGTEFNAILNLDYSFLLSESFMTLFVSSVLKFNSDVHGFGPFLSILLTLGSPFIMETHGLPFGHFICSICWILFSSLLPLSLFMKLPSFDFAPLGLIIYLKNIFLSLFIYLPILLSRKFPELYLSTYLLGFSYSPIKPFLKKLFLRFLSAFWMFLYKGFLFFFHECNNPSQSFSSVFLGHCFLFLFQIPFCSEFFSPLAFKVGLFTKITGHHWTSAYIWVSL